MSRLCTKLYITANAGSSAFRSCSTHAALQDACSVIYVIELMTDDGANYMLLNLTPGW